MEAVQKLQGMALSFRPSFTHAAPEAPLRPALASQTFPSALPPRPSPQLLTAPAMGAQLPPSAFAQHTAQHIPPPPGGQSFRLVGAQYPVGLPPSTVPVQQLSLQHSASSTTLHASYSYPLHQQSPTPTCIPAHTAHLHGYAAHHVAPPGDVMVDPKEHLGATC